MHCLIRVTAHHHHGFIDTPFCFPVSKLCSEGTWKVDCRLSIPETKSVFSAAITILCRPCRLQSNFRAPWTPPFSYVNFICLMHSYCSFTSLLDPVNGGVCQCINSRACRKLPLSCYSMVQPTVIIGIPYLYGTMYGNTDRTTVA